MQSKANEQKAKADDEKLILDMLMVSKDVIQEVAADVGDSQTFEKYVENIDENISRAASANNSTYEQYIDNIEIKLRAILDERDNGKKMDDEKKQGENQENKQQIDQKVESQQLSKEMLPDHSKDSSIKSMVDENSLSDEEKQYSKYLPKFGEIIEDQNGMKYNMITIGFMTRSDAIIKFRNISRALTKPTKKQPTRSWAFFFHVFVNSRRYDHLIIEFNWDAAINEVEPLACSSFWQDIVQKCNVLQILSLDGIDYQVPCVSWSYYAMRIGKKQLNKEELRLNRLVENKERLLKNSQSKELIPSEELKTMEKKKNKKRNKKNRQKKAKTAKQSSEQSSDIKTELNRQSSEQSSEQSAEIKADLNVLSSEQSSESKTELNGQSSEIKAELNKQSCEIKAELDKTFSDPPVLSLSVLSLSPSFITESKLSETKDSNNLKGGSEGPVPLDSCGLECIARYKSMNLKLDEMSRIIKDATTKYKHENQEKELAIKRAETAIKKAQDKIKQYETLKAKAEKQHHDLAEKYDNKIQELNDSNMSIRILRDELNHKDTTIKNIQTSLDQTRKSLDQAKYSAFETEEKFIKLSDLLKIANANANESKKALQIAKQDLEDERQITRNMEIEINETEKSLQNVKRDLQNKNDMINIINSAKNDAIFSTMIEIELKKSENKVLLEANEALKKDVETLKIFSINQDKYWRLTNQQTRLDESKRTGDLTQYSDEEFYKAKKLHDDYSHVMYAESIRREEKKKAEILAKEKINYELKLAREKMDAERLCVVCQDKPADTILMECGHLKMCIHCCTEIMNSATKLCPLCRGTITSFKKVFQ